MGITPEKHQLTSVQDLRTKNIVGLVIMSQPPAGLDVEAQEFMENPREWSRPWNTHWQKKSIPLARLQEETFLVRESGSGTRIAMERFFNERGMKLKTGMEVGSNEAIKQSVQAGLGLGLLSRATIEQELALKRLAVLDIADFPIMRHWYVVYRRGKRLSAAAEVFKQFMFQEAGLLLNPGQTTKKGGRGSP